MTTRTVTGNIKTLTDSAVSSGVVTFEKVVTSTTGNTIHQFGTTTATTDGSGDFSIALAVPASGSYRYRMILPNGDAFYFSIESGASVNVATLIVAETITDSDAIVEALAAYEPLLGTPSLDGAILSSTAAGVRSWRLCKLNATAAPTVNDDSGDGYGIGSIWVDTTNDNAYIATDVTVGAANWEQINGAGGGASDVTDLTTTTGNVAEMLNVAAGGGLQYRTVAQVLADLRDSGALATPDLGVTVQGYSAKTAAIAALTWAANSIIWLTGTATASVQALAAHVVTFLQSASAADARAAIGAGTGNGDVTAAATFGTDNAVLRADGTGKGAQSIATVTIADNGQIVAQPIVNSSYGMYVANGGSSSTGLRANGTAYGLEGQSSTGVPIYGVVQAATSTSAVAPVTNLLARASGTPGAGFGASQVVYLESSTTNDVLASRMVTLWNVAAHASRVPDGVLYLTDSSAEREIWRGRATGSAAAIGFLGATPVVRAATIADPSGGGTVDAEARTAINAILVVLENLGFVATA